MISEKAGSLFSKRAELKALTKNYAPHDRVARAIRFREMYERWVIPALRSDVIVANSMLSPTEVVVSNNGVPQTNHGAILTTFDAWVDQPSNPQVLEKIKQRQNTYEDTGVMFQDSVDMVFVGLAGLGRITHVDMNGQLKKDMNSIDAATTEPKLRELYQVLDIRHLPPHTIDGNAIDWNEISQDWITTYERQGNKEQAIRETEVALEEIQLRKKTLGEKRDVGMSSFEAVLWVKRGRLNHTLPNLTQGLRMQIENSREQFNPGRLVTFAKWTLSAAKDPEYQASIPQRLEAISNSGFALSTAFIHNPQETAKELGLMRLSSLLKRVVKARQV